MENKKTVVAVIVAIIAVIAGIAIVMSLSRGRTSPRGQTPIMGSGIKLGSNASDTAASAKTAVDIVPGTYTVDPKESWLTWRGEKITGVSHAGTVNIVSGFMEAKDKQFVRGEFTIDMDTIASADSEQLVTHLKSDDFFAVSAYPTATFAFTGIQYKAGNEYLVTGNLTLKGQTHTISFPALLTHVSDGYLADADIAIDRTVWDIRYGSGKFFDNLGDNLIKDNIDLTLHLAVYNEELMTK